MDTFLHDDELSIDLDLVRRLVDAEFPKWSALPLEALEASGSSNALFRLGTEFLVRLPREPGGGVAIEKEQRWLGELGQRLSVRVPEVVALGDPAHGYGERWSVVRWLEGERAQAWTSNDLDAPQRAQFAADLGELVHTLRNLEVPGSALADPALRSYRGERLAVFDDATKKNIQLCRCIEGLDLDLDAAAELWDEALELPEASVVAPEHWYHGDLVGENLLLTGGRLSALLDFGGLSVGDPGIDLHGAWELFDPAAREVFRERTGVSDAQWLLGRAWALGVALSVLSYYWNTMPARCRDRLAMVRAVLADAEGNP